MKRHHKFRLDFVNLLLSIRWLFFKKSVLYFIFWRAWSLIFCICFIHFHLNKYNLNTFLTCLFKFTSFLALMQKHEKCPFPALYIGLKYLQDIQFVWWSYSRVSWIFTSSKHAFFLVNQLNIEIYNCRLYILIFYTTG